ncbi:MAG: hypothetical protein ACI89X_001581 [Planctomycetota bacterium]
MTGKRRPERCGIKRNSFQRAEGSARSLAAALLASIVAATVTAQDPTQPPTGAAQDPTAPTVVNEYQFDNAGSAGRQSDDYYEFHYQGGFRLKVPKLGLHVRGENLLILNDLEATRAQFESNKSSGLPTRGISSPAPRRRLSPEAIRGRLERALSAVGRTKRLPDKVLDTDALNLFRYLYCEGGIVVVQDGVEVMRCDRMWISPIDDRVVVENAELRYITGTGATQQTLVVRGPRLVKQGGRWIGTDLVLTTCTADKPHFGLAVKEAEIIERPGEFEVVSRGQTLQIGGANMLPLPDARVFTASQSEFPIKRVTASYNNLLGAQLRVLLGLPWNTTGGALHNWVTGRPANEFRGEWEFGLGWIQERGYPLEGALTYGVPGLYEGRTEVYYLDDNFTDRFGRRNLREIRNNIDGTQIRTSQRTVLSSQNRFYVAGDHEGQNTHVDLVAFHASDAAAYPEFYQAAYRGAEVPETSAYLHHASGNHLLTVGARFNANDFSYRSDRFLDTRFVEELPVMTYQWLAQPIAETPWHTPIVVDVETQIGQRRSNFDDRAGTRISDRTLRADQHVEFSTPFHLGGLNIRPYFSSRGTFYDDTPAGKSEARIALEAGFQVGTRLSNTWHSVDENGEPNSVRHVIAPRLTYRNRYHVDDQPGSFFQYDNVNPQRLSQLGYDSIDLLSEREIVRFEVRNLFQHMVETTNGRQPRDFVSIDFAQDLLPNSTRDNRGEELGLFFYDALWRPTADWLPFDNFALGLYGDIDWARGMQTLDVELQFGKVIGIDWVLEYREDTNVDGAIALACRADLFDRWSVFGRAQRDLERDEWLTYIFGLRRNDHDWSIGMTAVYNPFVDETTFGIEFEPRFGRAKRRRTDRFGGSDMGDSSRYAY